MELQPKRLRPLRQDSGGAEDQTSQPVSTYRYHHVLHQPWEQELTSSLALSLVYCVVLEEYLASVNLEFLFCELEIRASALLSSEASVGEAIHGALC